MPDLPRSTLVAYVAAVVAVVLVGSAVLRGREGGARALPAAPLELSSETGRDRGLIHVHVAGAVRRPGVYRLRAGSRGADAVRRAGGPTRRADLTAVNLAARLEDGRQVVVPARVRVGGGARGGGVAAGPAAGPLNLNTATMEQLDQLDGIGPGLAQRILDYREEHGGFGSVEELSQVPGIGDARMAALREAVGV